MGNCFRLYVLGKESPSVPRKTMQQIIEGAGEDSAFNLSTSSSNHSYKEENATTPPEEAEYRKLSLNSPAKHTLASSNTDALVNSNNDESQGNNNDQKLSEEKANSILDQIFFLCESGVAPTIEFLLHAYPSLEMYLNETRKCHVCDIDIEMTPLMLASACGHTNVILTLLSYHNLAVNARDQYVVQISHMHVWHCTPYSSVKHNWC
jgi:hypothetical protein